MDAMIGLPSIIILASFRFSDGRTQQRKYDIMIDLRMRRPRSIRSRQILERVLPIFRSVAIRGRPGQRGAK